MHHGRRSPAAAGRAAWLRTARDGAQQLQRLPLSSAGAPRKVAGRGQPDVRLLAERSRHPQLTQQDSFVSQQAAACVAGKPVQYNPHWAPVSPQALMLRNRLRHERWLGRPQRERRPSQSRQRSHLSRAGALAQACNVAALALFFTVSCPLLARRWNAKVQPDVAARQHHPGPERPDYPATTGDHEPERLLDRAEQSCR